MLRLMSLKRKPMPKPMCKDLPLVQLPLKASVQLDHAHRTSTCKPYNIKRLSKTNGWAPQ
eukprot:4034064-Amphidinium_carterae.1